VKDLGHESREVSRSLPRLDAERDTYYVKHFT
jgi:hypothetical protein